MTIIVLIVMIWSGRRRAAVAPQQAYLDLFSARRRFFSTQNAGWLFVFKVLQHRGVYMTSTKNVKS